MRVAYLMDLMACAQVSLSTGHRRWHSSLPGHFKHHKQTIRTMHDAIASAPSAQPCTAQKADIREQDLAADTSIDVQRGASSKLMPNKPSQRRLESWSSVGQVPKSATNAASATAGVKRLKYHSALNSWDHFKLAYRIRLSDPFVHSMEGPFVNC